MDATGSPPKFWSPETSSSSHAVVQSANPRLGGLPLTPTPLRCHLPVDCRDEARCRFQSGGSVYLSLSDINT